MSDFGHGAVGTREQAFTTLLPLRTAPQKTELLVALAASIQAVVDEVKDGADGEENLWMPAGYTYFGQFIDRDENSIISQIQLSFIKFHNAVVAQIKKKQPEVKGTALFNQARNQVRWAYQKLVIEDFLPRIVRADVLKGLNDKTSLDRHYALYDTPEKRSNLPREFVGAAYRFGHSGVRFGYRLNTTTRLSIFVSSNHPERDSLLGFDPLPQSQVIDDWGRFFPSTDPSTLPSTLGCPPTGADGLDENPSVRLQFAYKIDPTLVDPLTILPPSVLPTSTNPKGAIQEIKDTIGSELPDPKGRPSLALLNLLRGNTYLLQGGQAIATVLKAKGYPVEPLASKYLVTRQVIKDSMGVPTSQSKFKAIDPVLQQDTPQWFYVLAEAQQSVIDTQCHRTVFSFISS